MSRVQHRCQRFDDRDQPVAQAAEHGRPDPIELETGATVVDRLFGLAPSDAQGSVPFARGSPPEAFTDVLATVKLDPVAAVILSSPPALARCPVFAVRRSQPRRSRSRRLAPLAVALFGTRAFWHPRRLAVASSGSRVV